MTWWHRINRFVRDQDPWLAVVFFATTLFFAYLALPDRGVLGYRQSIIKIFDSKIAGTLRIVGPNNQPIESDVYAVETTLRNAGKLKFDDDVRHYPQIRFPNGRIVETRVSASTDPETMQVTAVQGPQPDTVEVKWHHFDPGQLVKITTLVVASAEVIKPEVQAEIVGVRIAEVAPDLPYPAFLAIPVMGVVGLVCAAQTIPGVSRIIAGIRERRLTTIALGTLMTVFFGFFAGLFFLALYIYWYAPTVP